MAKALYGYLGSVRSVADPRLIAEITRLRARVGELEAQVATLEAALLEAPDDLTPLDALKPMATLRPSDDSRPAFA